MRIIDRRYDPWCPTISEVLLSAVVAGLLLLSVLGCASSIDFNAEHLHRQDFWPVHDNSMAEDGVQSLTREEAIHGPSGPRDCC